MRQCESAPGADTLRDRGGSASRNRSGCRGPLPVRHLHPIPQTSSSCGPGLRRAKSVRRHCCRSRCVHLLYSVSARPNAKPRTESPPWSPTCATVSTRTGLREACSFSSQETNLSAIVSQLEVQRKQTQQELARLDRAIAALRGLDNRNGVRPKLVRSGWKMTAEGRRKISQAKKAWWAAKRGKSNTEPKRTLSLVARRKIAATQRARWARQKKAA